MKLQAAIDRRSLQETIELAKKLDPIVDIVEIGTSAIKDFGFAAFRNLKSEFHHAEILFDIKTNDEGDYEFKSGYKAADKVFIAVWILDVRFSNAIIFLPNQLIYVTIFDQIQFLTDLQFFFVQDNFLLNAV